eukprot:500515-Rhodomonas_salina.1
MLRNGTKKAHSSLHRVRSTPLPENKTRRNQRQRRARLVLNTTPRTEKAFDLAAGSGGAAQTWDRPCEIQTPFARKVPAQQPPLHLPPPNAPFQRSKAPFQRSKAPFQRSKAPFPRSNAPFPRSNAPFPRSNA